MGVVSQLLGFALLVAWAAFTFGWHAGLLAAGIALLIVGVAAGDVQVPRPRLRRRAR